MPGSARRQFLHGVAMAAAFPAFALAQPAPKPARIGWITAQRAASLIPYLAAMREGLARYGYIEGQNLTIEYRYGDDDITRVPDLANDLIRSSVDVIVSQGAATYEIAKLALPIPVVYVTSVDPVFAGFAESLAKPIGNMSGLTFMAFEFAAKRLELLREIVPGLRRVAVIGSPEHPGSHLERAYSEEAAQRLNMLIAYRPTLTVPELDATLKELAADQPEAMSILADGFTIQNRQVILDFALQRRIPAISGWSVFARSGALCSYGPQLTECYRRLAYYIVRVLNGTRPADLPIERPSKFEMVLNQRTAKSLGVTFPRAILARADEVIG